MSIPRFSVNNPIAANLLMLALLGGGLYCALTLPKELFPELKLSAVRVTLPYPGSTPAEVEKGMVIRMEEAISDLSRVKEIRSSIYEGGATIYVEFEAGTDVAQAVNDVKAEIDRLDNLPEEAELIETRRVEMITPVIQMVVYGDTTERNLKALAERLRDELVELDEVSEATVSGVREPEISIEVDPAKLEKYGLTFREVAAQVGADNIDIPGGQLKAAAGDIRIRTLGEQEHVHALEEIIVRSEADGRTVRLGEVATVIDGFKDTVIRGRYMGKPSANINVSKTSEQDAIRIARAVEAFVAAKQSEFSGNVRLAARNNTSIFIEGHLNLLIRNAFLGLLLVFASLTIFLNFRVAFWAAAGMPVALLGAFIILKFAGFTTNLVTLFGMIVILGMVVDDAIVLGENVYRRFQEGLSAKEAAIVGSQEVALPVLATITTTVAAFAPLALISGTVGEMWRPIAGTVIAALLISLIEAFVILPAHLHGTLKKVRRSGVMSDGGAAGEKKSSGGGWGRRFWEKKEHLFDVQMRDAYVRLLKMVIRWRYVSLTVAVMLLVVTVAMVLNDRPPMVMMGEVDSDMMLADLEMAAGTPVARTESALAAIERAAMSIPEIKDVYSLLGQQAVMSMVGGGMRRATGDPATLGQVMMELYPAELRDRHSDDVLAELRSKTEIIPGVTTLDFSAIHGGPTGAEFEIQVRGEDLDMVNRAVEHVKTHLGRFVGVADIRDDMNAGKLEARIRLSPVGRISGVTVRELAMQMRSAVFGAEAQTLQREREEVEVRVRLKREARDSIGDLERFRVATAGGGRVPFGELATLTTGRGFDSLARVNRKRAVTVEADYDASQTSTPAHKIATALEANLANVGTLFPGVTLSFEGEKREMSMSFTSLRNGFLFSMFTIYIILALVFRSYSQPLIIMFAVPFGLIGAVFGHIVMGYSLTMVSWIGLVALSGVVVNDSLILIDFINRKRAEGLSAHDAIIQGARMRLRPILLTSITTILGLAPLMAERSFQAQALIPMGISIAFGLAFATVLTLLILPCLYFILHDIQVLTAKTLGGMRTGLALAWNGRAAKSNPAQGDP